MLALNRTTIDFFSLDVEGAELEVLKGIDFSKLNIRTMTVEYAHLSGGKMTLIRYLSKHDMKMYKIVDPGKTYADDVFFVNQQSFPNLKPVS